MKKISAIILSPFQKLPVGYYRLLLAGWIILPAALALIQYASMRTFRVYWSDDAPETSFKWFFILLLLYYPAARICIWLWQGFIKEGTLQVKHENDLLSLHKEIRGKDMKHENELQSLKRQIEQRESSITILKQKLLEETEQKHKYELLSQVLKQKIERNEQGQRPQ